MIQGPNDRSAQSGRTAQSDRTMRRIVVRGRVQGVGFRAFVEDAAILNGVEGWARNRRDGTVEAVLAGPAEQVARVMEACRRGPDSADVQAVDEYPAVQKDVDQRRPGDLFTVLPTA
jgi:acylphosphatase